MRTWLLAIAAAITSEAMFGTFPPSSQSFRAKKANGDDDALVVIG